MGLFDVHAHLTHPDLLPQVDAVLQRAADAGVTSIVCNGLNPRDNERVAALAKRSALVRPAFGLYPVDAVLQEMVQLGVEYPRDDEPVSPRAGVDWVRDHVHEAFAVGEIGLDGYWVPEGLWAAQEAVFRELVTIALDADKPIIVHTRKREARCFEILLEMGAARVDWHCFGGRVKLARRIAEHGHYLSIPANARKNEAFTAMLRSLPRERVLLETDCPYLSPDKSYPNEPAFVRDTALYASELWGVSLAEVQARLEANYTALFAQPP